MISLSKRLLTVAEMVPDCRILADVGTDHGYLPVWLLQHGRVECVLASDVRSGPLQRARETAQSFDLSDRMETILADGLKYPCADRAEVVTICGMGGETMISILSAAPWTTEGRRLILQPQSKLPELESWLSSHGFSIDDAHLCLDAGKLYLALSVFGGGPWKMTAEQLLLARRDPLLPVYLRRELQKAQFARDGLTRSALSPMQKQALQATDARTKELEQYEKEMEKW